MPAVRQVMMATKNDTGRMYAMKVRRPAHRRARGGPSTGATLARCAQVLRKEHLLFRGASSVKQAITEKQVLQEMAAKPHPYIVSLNFAFQDMVRLAGRSAARPAAQPLGPWALRAR